MLLFLVGIMYVDQCPNLPFAPKFLIVYGISFVIGNLVLYKVAKTEERGIWLWIGVLLYVFLWAWMITGQFTSYIHC